MIDRESQKPNNIKNKDGDWLHFENIFTKQVFSYAHCHWSIAAFTTSGYVNKNEQNRIRSQCHEYLLSKN